MIATSSLGESLSSAAAVARAAVPKPAKTPAPEPKKAVDLASALSPADAVSLSFPLLKGSAEKPADEPSPAQASAERIQRIVDAFQQQATALNFEVDEKNNQVIVRVVNRSTGEVVRQIPPEEMIRMARELKDLRGILFDQTS
jgi:flagellar protein FlaG